MLESNIPDDTVNIKDIMLTFDDIGLIYSKGIQKLLMGVVKYCSTLAIEVVLFHDSNITRVFVISIIKYSLNKSIHCVSNTSAAANIFRITPNIINLTTISGTDHT